MRHFTDIHVHTTNSHDGRSTVDDYVSLLRERGDIAAIGLAEHVDFMPECGGYGTFDAPKYLGEVARACSGTAAAGRLIAGAEIDYSDAVEADIRAALETYPYRYTIASVHVVLQTPFSTSEKMELFKRDGIFRELLKEYYHQITASLHMKEFDAIGHAGIFKRYMPSSLLTELGLDELIALEDRKLAEACAKSGKILEINTSGFRSPLKDSLPDSKFIKIYYDAGGRKTALGSDSHSASGVGADFAQAAAFLRGIGFTDFCTPWDRG